MRLTSAKIQQLMNKDKGVSRSALAAEVAKAFSAGQFSDKETEIAIDIFRIIMRDAEKNIRKILAENLCHSANAPHDIISSLASDEFDISASILEHSEVLTDDDLVAIIKSSNEVLKMCSIARRARVSGLVSENLLERGYEQVISQLFANKGAILGAPGLEKAWGAISTNSNLLEALVHHGNLPLSIVEKTFVLVSDELKKKIIGEYQLKSPIAQKYIADAREWELLGLAPVCRDSNPDDDKKVDELVEHLADTGRLTHSLIIRALCTGCLNLFEAGMARFAEVPRGNARILLMGGSNSFAAIYRAANMPECFIVAAEKLLNVALEVSEYGYSKPQDFKKQVFEKIYSRGYNRSVEGMSYLLAIIDDKLPKTNSIQEIREAA